MLKPPGTPEPDPAGDSLATLKGWTTCICVVSIPADLDDHEAPIIRAVSRRFAQEAGFPITTLVDASLTALCGPGTKESSIKALVRFPDTSETWRDCSFGQYDRLGHPLDAAEAIFKACIDADN